MKYLLIFFLITSNCYAALNDTVCANLVVAQIKLVNTGLTGAAETEAKTYWTAICKGILDHIKTSGDLNLGAGDISVPGLGLLDSVAGPVTGTAQSSAAILTGKIQ